MLRGLHLSQCYECYTCCSLSDKNFSLSDEFLSSNLDEDENLEGSLVNGHVSNESHDRGLTSLDQSASLRHYVQRTEQHCEKVMKEFQKMKNCLKNVAGLD